MEAHVIGETGLVITSLTANAPVIAEGEVWRKARERLVRSLELAAELQAPGQRMPISPVGIATRGRLSRL